MTYQYPPLPPEYSTVLLTRWSLFVVALVGVAVVRYRILHPTKVRRGEMGLWVLAAFVVVFVGGGLGLVRHSYWSDGWLLPAMAAPLAVAVAGMIICLRKIWVEGTWLQKGLSVLWTVLGAVIVSFGLLVAVISADAREAPMRTQCKSNLKQIGLAMYNYHETASHFPAAVASDDGIAVSWRVSILPFLDQNPAFNRYDQKVAWDAAPNLNLAKLRVPQYVCYSNAYPDDATGRWFSAYSMPTGQGTIGGNPLGTKTSAITDGISNTALVVEACGALIIWTEPLDIDTAAQPAGFNLEGTRFGHSAGWLSSCHRGGAYVLLADGMVKMLSPRTDPITLKSLVTIDGGDDVGELSR